jgi:hypothetical protein
MDAKAACAAPARRFHYMGDPVFLCAALLYFANRYVVKPLTLGHVVFFHYWFNDLICIPFCLPPCLWACRRLKLRGHDGYPTRAELVIYVIVWSIMFELVAPFWLHTVFPRAVADVWDAVSYAVGAAVAGYFWGAWRLPAAGRVRIEPAGGVET